MFVNINQIPIENITKQNIDISSFQDSIVSKNNINNYGSIELDRNYFLKYCINSNKNQNLNYNINNNKINEFNNEIKSCQFYIYIVQSKSSLKYQKDNRGNITKFNRAFHN